MEPEAQGPGATPRQVRRRRVVVGLLAAAVVAVPSIAIASSGGSSGGGAPPAGNDDLPSMWMQDKPGGGERGPSEGRRHQDRDCPKEGHGGRDDADSSGGGPAGKQDL